MERLFFIAVVVMYSTVLTAQSVVNENNSTEQVGKRSVIIFNKTIHDFGSLQIEEEASVSFIFKNISKTPIILENVNASCGCTGVEWSQQTIAKRKKGKIKVSYDTKKVGRFTETIKVYIAGQKQPVQLEIRGTVIAPNANEYYSKKNKYKQE